MSYRAYKDTEEMIADFKQRFGIKSDPDKPVFREPCIWIKDAGVEHPHIAQITEFRTKVVVVFQGMKHLKDLFEDYAYLDGSVIGKEV